MWQYWGERRVSFEINFFLDSNIIGERERFLVIFKCKEKSLVKNFLKEIYIC